MPEYTYTKSMVTSSIFLKYVVVGAEFCDEGANTLQVPGEYSIKLCRTV
jgi:hypothetical protein